MSNLKFKNIYQVNLIGVCTISSIFTPKFPYVEMVPRKRWLCIASERNDKYFLHKFREENFVSRRFWCKFESFMKTKGISY